MYYLGIAVDANYKLKSRNRGAVNIDFCGDSQYSNNEKTYREFVKKHAGTAEVSKCSSSLTTFIDILY